MYAKEFSSKLHWHSKRRVFDVVRRRRYTRRRIFQERRDDPRRDIVFRPEEAKEIQSSSKKYHVNFSPFPGVVIEEAYENQRRLGGWKPPMLPTDRRPWTDESGHTVRDKETIDYVVRCGDAFDPPLDA
eukprot:GABV01007033.1.p1 GENE.GABV01007033.1~~GABV01007033.1.p1  ORF type:complete len:138 (-),score=48.43 GABV01007033.1:3-389(-)